VEGAATHEQAPPIGAGGNVQRIGILQNPVSKALFHRLDTSHIRGFGHHV
jgi:hypothetical protein